MVEMASQISTTNISVQGRTHVVQYMIGTSRKSGLACGLVLWVTVQQVSHILAQCLTGNVDWDFLLNGLPQVLELVPLAVRVWFMHDGAPAHFSRPVQDVLNNAYHDKWVGRARLVAWSPHCPILSPSDFYLQGHLNIPSVFISN